MHEVEQAVHDAEAEEAELGRDDSTGGQGGLLLLLAPLPMAGRALLSAAPALATGAAQLAGNPCGTTSLLSATLLPSCSACRHPAGQLWLL